MAVAMAEGSTPIADAQKRKIEEEAGSDTSSAKRLVPDALAKMEVDAGLRIKNADFSPELLHVYYEKMFPFTQMFRWLSYKNDPKGSSRLTEKDFFLRREFTFVLQGDIFCRYLCFRDVDEFKAQVMARQPIRMEIGAVFTHPPKNHNMVIKDAYKPLEKELVFDIDMDDYDDIRTCCSGAKICSKCWTFMKAAIKTLDRALREDFGFDHILFVFSGRRGVHCWVGDSCARQLPNEHRAAVADYLTVVASGKNRARAEIKMNGCEEMHPSIIEAFKICEPFFKDDPNGVLHGQDILKKGPHLANILETMTVSEREVISKYVNDYPQASSRDIWVQFEKMVSERSKSAATFRQRAELKTMLKDVVLQYTYPRLDINVSKQMNHLLKSPFVVHPKTGKVCVPIDPYKLDTFDPLKVPTIGELVEEMNQSGDPRQTSLRQYTHFFEIGFLQPLELAVVKEMQAKGDIDF